MVHVGAGASRVCKEDDERQGARVASAIEARSSPPLDFALDNMMTMRRDATRSLDSATERCRPRARAPKLWTEGKASPSVRDRGGRASSPPLFAKLSTRVDSCRTALSDRFAAATRCARSERKCAVWLAEAPQSAIVGALDAAPRRLSGYRLESAPFYAALECASSGAYRVECAAVHTVSARFCCVVVASAASDPDCPHADPTPALVLELIRESPSSTGVAFVARHDDGAGNGDGDGDGDDAKSPVPSSSSSSSRILAEASCQLETDGVTPTLQILYRGRLAVDDRISLRLSLRSRSHASTRTKSTDASAPTVERRVLPVRLAPWLPGAATFQISRTVLSTGRPAQSARPLVSRI